LSKADPFTETVVSKDNRTLFRARFAGLDRDQAEAVCKTLKRADISCMTVRNRSGLTVEVCKAGAASAGFVVFVFKRSVPSDLIPCVDPGSREENASTKI